MHTSDEFDFCAKEDCGTPGFMKAKATGSIFTKSTTIQSLDPGWKSFDNELPDVGDRIVVVFPPEQLTLPTIVDFNTDFEWIDGTIWCRIPKGYTL